MIFERRRIERPNLSLVAFTLLTLIEAALSFVAENSALDHLRDELRHHERLVLRIVGKIFVQVLDDVCEHIEADEIECAKRRRLRPTGGGPGDLVYLFDRVSVVQHRAHRYQRTMSADAIRDKIRP